jgi:hypothetical protein
MSMSLEYLEEGRAWRQLTRRTSDPKLMWIEAQLETRGIAFRRNRASFHAPILEVDAEKFDEACEVLFIKAGLMFLPEESDIIIDDLDDDHPFFVDWAVVQGRMFGGRNVELGKRLAPLELTDDTFAGLQYEDVEIPGIAIPVRMVDVNSRMLSALGKYDPYDEWISTETGQDDKHAAYNYLFTRFKGSADYYRYRNVTLAQFLELLRRERSGESIGGYFDATFKKNPALYPYEKWDETLGKWITPEPKRRAKLKKNEEVALLLPKEQKPVPPPPDPVTTMVERPTTLAQSGEGEYDDEF